MAPVKRLGLTEARRRAQVWAAAAEASELVAVRQAEHWFTVNRVTTRTVESLDAYLTEVFAAKDPAMVRPLKPALLKTGPKTGGISLDSPKPTPIPPREIPHDLILGSADHDVDPCDPPLFDTTDAVRVLKPTSKLQMEIEKLAYRQQAYRRAAAFLTNETWESEVEKQQNEFVWRRLMYQLAGVTERLNILKSKLIVPVEGTSLPPQKSEGILNQSESTFQEPTRTNSHYR